ncbi:hypothetical protein SB861_11400 [Paraburkholderia sp. SIMBA_049]
MDARVLLIPLCIVTLTCNAIAQAAEKPLAADSSSNTYRSPLQQNFDRSMATPRKDDSDFERRCREIIHNYIESFRPPEQDRANAVAPKFGGYSGEPETTLQGYYRRQDAENAYRESRCK